jgi:hypothetical protein
MRLPSETFLLSFPRDSTSPSLLAARHRRRERLGNLLRTKMDTVRAPPALPSINRCHPLLPSAKPKTLKTHSPLVIDAMLTFPLAVRPYKWGREPLCSLHGPFVPSAPRFHRAADELQPSPPLLFTARSSPPPLRLPLQLMSTEPPFSSSRIPHGERR